MKNPDFILTSDWHIRDDKPICRTDNYLEAQEKKIRFILSLTKDYNCPILVAGDFGHRPLWGDRLLNWFMEIYRSFDFPVSPIVATVGQHDLLYHKLSAWNEGGLGILHKSGVIKLELSGFNTSQYGQGIYSFPYNQEIRETPMKIALIHKMVIKSQNDKLWSTQEAVDGRRLLKDFPCYDLIVSGDNHQSFVVKYKDRVLVNPGSIMRMSANQVEHRPSVYLWFAEKRCAEMVFLPLESDVIDRGYLDHTKERNREIEGFISRLKEHQEIGFNYETNLKEFFENNRIENDIKEKVWGTLCH